MATFDLEEQEKISAIKAWWAKWGNLISTATTILALIVFCWYGWQWYKSYRAHQAFGYFDVILQASSQKTEDADQRIQVAADTLEKSYADTEYASRGLILAAHYFTQNKQYDKAQSILQWILQQSNAVAMKPIARLRLANIAMDQKKYDQALKWLQNPPAGYEAIYFDRQGDVAILQGHKKEAADLWEKALSHHPQEEFTQLIKLKLQTLSVTTQTK